MRYIYTTIFLLGVTLSYSQTIQPIPDKVLFEYDNSGNQVVRSLCINCLVGKSKKANNSGQVDVPAPEFVTNKELKYYPNPVKEELNLQWELPAGNSVHSISVYSLTGQLLRNHKNLENTTSETISFADYAKGIYSVLVSYSSGDVKSIKIIKE